MKTIKEAYEHYLNTKSDINEHLPIFKQVAEVARVTEFGVRDVVSTWGFLRGCPSKMVSYDIERHPNVETALNYAHSEEIDFTFHTANTLEIEIEETDVLFIDTLHTYKQLKSELTLHGDKSMDLIIMHDTQTFGTNDMPDVYGSDESQYVNITAGGHGLKQAITEFLDENKKWQLLRVYANNNGLTLLKRVG